MSNHEHREHLTFVPADTVVGFLQSDPDHYYDTFTRFDFLKGCYILKNTFYEKVIIKDARRCIPNWDIFWNE